MRHLIFVSISFYIISCNSKNANPCEKIELEEIINFEQEKSQLIEEKLYKIDHSVVHVSFGYMDTIMSLTGDRNKFIPVLNKLRQLIEEFDSPTFLELQS